MTTTAITGPLASGSTAPPPPSSRGSASSERQPASSAALTRLRSVWDFLKQVGTEWDKDNAGRLAAALALYTLLSIAPLLVIAVAVAGMAFGAEAARGQISQEISTLVGPQAGQAIEGLVAQ